MSPTLWTSSIVESRPKEKRTKELAETLRPIAAMTCDGSNEPAEHAEPLEAQIPSTSIPANKAMLSAPRTIKDTVLANESLAGLTISQSSIFWTTETNISASDFKRFRSKTGGLTN